MSIKKGRLSTADKIKHIQNYTNPTHEFAKDIEAVFGVFIDPIADGEIHRFDDPEGKPGNKACWYRFRERANGASAGWFGSWKRGATYSWHTAGVSVKDKPRLCAEKRLLLAADRLTNIHSLAVKHHNAARKANSIWSTAKPATVEHPYIKRKNVPALGLKESKGFIVAPIQNLSGNIVNLQFIGASGTKTYSKGGEIKGCFTLIGAAEIPKKGVLYVCEGIATGLTIWQLQKVPVVCALSCGNISTVCVGIRTEYPNIEFVIAADNDHKTKENPGITKAYEAAKLVGATVQWPRACGPECTCTDFNDYANCKKSGGF